MDKDKQVNCEESISEWECKAPFYMNAKKELIKDLVAGQDILDIGCGNGDISIYLAENGFNVTANDISGNLLKNMRLKCMEKNLKIGIIEGDLSNLKIGKKFDNIILADVIEHINDREAVIKKIKSFLKPSGSVIVVVPAYEFLRTKRDDAIGHYIRFNKKNLTKLFLDEGFVIRKIAHWEFINIFNILFTKILRQKEYVYSINNKILNKILDTWFRKVENRLLFPIGAELVAVFSLENT